MRPAFFCVVIQWVAVIPYRRFGKPDAPIFKGQEDGTDMLSRNIGKQLQLKQLQLLAV